MRVIRLCSLLIVLVTASPAFGEAVRGIRALTTRPVVPRGGVMMIPLGAERPGDRWPSELQLVLADGSTIDGIVAWLSARSPEPGRVRRWSEDGGGLAVRAIRPDDDTSGPGAGSGEPYLLARIPADAEGPIRLRRQELNPIWHDPDRPYLGEPLPGPDRPVLDRVASPDRPDPLSPFEYWRWVLLADRLDRRPPYAAVYGPVGSLVAEHYADLFRIGLARLASESPGVALTCRDLLTQTAVDGDRSFASWVADAEAIGQLLATLTNFRRREPEVARAALAWADAHSGMLIWPELAGPERVELAAVNRSPSPIVARLSWQNVDEPPIAVELPPRRLRRIVVDRPRSVEPDAPMPDERSARSDGGVLEVRAGTSVERFAFGPTRIDARPPGVFIGPLVPALTLADVERKRGPDVEAQHATFAHLRFRSGRWELFFDCRRPGGAVLAGASIGDLDDAGDIAGIEAVTLLLGPAATPRGALVISERGPYRIIGGLGSEGLEVHRASYSDRWYCRIVLPRSWLADPGTGRIDSVQVGFRRTHAGRAAIETAPHTSMPWRQRAGRIIIGLDQ